MKLKISLLVASLFFCSGTSFASTTEWMKAAVNEQYNDAVQIRRDIHQHAELGNQEFRTQKVVVDFLKKQNIDVVTGWKDAPTAVIGIINPDKKNTIALRTELDALPIKENTGLPFASTMTGKYLGKVGPVSHMCGHDVHMAMLMSAAKILQQNKDKFDNRVVLIFQPAEEGDSLHDPFEKNAPLSGANALVNDGLIEKYDIKHVFGIHAMARQPAGKILVAKGAALNSADGFHIHVDGKQSHGAMPWAGTDATLTAANIVVGLQQIVSRNADLSEGMGVITVGKLNAGETANVMSGTADMTGTVRSNHNEVRDTLIKRIPEVAEGVADAAGAKAETQIAKIYPVTVNNPELVDKTVPLLKQNGIDAEISTWNPGASEDFSFYAAKVPSMFMFLGADYPDAKDVQNNHSDKFVVDETTMRTGIMAHLVAATAKY
ncbi:amidohydrolase [Salmonella enterica subsp. enterica serovar Montevideo]|nr:amidohydrolase [Salmonella enterica subsp. enterica serovar Montevideo]